MFTSFNKINANRDEIYENEINNNNNFDYYDQDLEDDEDKSNYDKYYPNRESEHKIPTRNSIRKILADNNDQIGNYDSLEKDILDYDDVHHDYYEVRSDINEEQKFEDEIVELACLTEDPDVNICNEDSYSYL